MNSKPEDEAEVRKEMDAKPPQVKIPELLESAFKVEPEVKVYFEKLSFNHQKEYTDYINEAKTEDAKLRRVEKTIAALLKDRAKK